MMTRSKDEGGLVEDNSFKKLDWVYVTYPLMWKEYEHAKHTVALTLLHHLHNVYSSIETMLSKRRHYYIHF